MNLDLSEELEIAFLVLLFFFFSYTVKRNNVKKLGLVPQKGKAQQGIRLNIIARPLNPNKKKQ